MVHAILLNTTENFPVYVEGQGGSWFLGFLISWFQSCLVSKCFGFLVFVFSVVGLFVSWLFVFFKFLGFKVSGFVSFQSFLASSLFGFKVPKIYQNSISCVLANSYPRLSRLY